MPAHDRVAPSHFVLHIWAEPAAEGPREWRGKVHHVASGDARYFRDWPSLVDFLERTLAHRIPESTPGGEPPT